MLTAWYDTFFFLRPGWSVTHMPTHVLANRTREITAVIGNKPIRPAHQRKRNLFSPINYAAAGASIDFPRTVLSIDPTNLWHPKKLFFLFCSGGKLLWASTPPHAVREGEVGVGIGEENQRSFYLLSACGRVCFSSALLEKNTQKRIKNSWKKIWQ